MTGHATIKTASDSWVDQGHVNAHHGDSQSLKMSNSANVERGLMHFALPFRKGATITIATLTLHARGDGWDDAATLTAKRITTKWREDRVTWHNKPDTTAVHAGTEAAITVADGAQIDVDVTDLIQDVADGSVRWHGFQLTVDQAGDHNVHSAESTMKGKRPELYIEWTYNPDQPTDLSPADDGVVSSGDVYLSWSRMTSTDKHAEQDAVRVQRDTVDTFDSGALQDSGWYLTGHAGVQSSDLGFPNVVDAGSYFWRVKVRDDAGATSGYSDAASFTRHNWADTLVITSPPGAVVEGTTPVFTWTFAPQEKYRAVLEMKSGTNDPNPDSDGSWDELEHDHDNWTTDDSQGFDLEAGVMRIKGVNGHKKIYRLTVFVKDGYDRVGTPGDPAWQRAQTDEFTITPSGIPNPVTKVVCVSDVDSPMTWVRWHRALAPDSFVIFKDDEAVIDGIDPIEAAVDAWDTTKRYAVGDHVVHTYAGPTTTYFTCISAATATDGEPQLEPSLWEVDADNLNYEQKYWGHTPGESNVYEVVANTDGNHSKDNDTFSRTLSADGLWLVAVADGTLVAFAELGGRTNRNLEIGETADMYNVVNRRAPVRVTGGIRGYEGSMSGKLGPLYNRTSNQWRTNMQKLKGRQNGEEVRVIMQGLNVPVTLGKISITPSPMAQLFDVSFEVFQTGEFFELGRSNA